MLRIVEVVAALLAVAVYFVADDPRDEATLYPVRCLAAPGSSQGAACAAIEPLRRTIYRVQPETGFVIYWSPDAPDSVPSRLTDCAVIDARNWTCAGRGGGAVRFRDGLGHRGDFGVDQSVYFVRGYQWHIARVAGGVAPFGVPRQFD